MDPDVFYILLGKLAGKTPWTSEEKYRFHEAARHWENLFREAGDKRQAERILFLETKAGRKNARLEEAWQRRRRSARGAERNPGRGRRNSASSRSEITT